MTEPTFWSTANKAFTQAERDAYNQFRADLYATADRLRERVRVVDDDSQVIERMNDLMEQILTMPTMEP